MEKPSVAFDSLPSGRPLQGKMALAAHSQSCHPRRMFGSRENEREGKKNGRKRRKTGKPGEKNGLKLCPKILYLSFYKAWFWDFLVKAPLQNYKNSLTNILTIGAKKEENQKRPKSKNKTGSRKSTRLEE